MFPLELFEHHYGQILQNFIIAPASSFSFRHVIHVCVCVAAVTAVVCLLLFFAHRLWRQQRRFSKVLLSRRDIVLVETEVQWTAVSSRLRDIATKEKVLGFDCEWVNRSGYVGRVALLQLAAADGLCVVLRLNKLEANGAFRSSLAHELKALLADRLVVKVGVGPDVDAKRLMVDYGLFVQSYLDLGWLATALFGNHLPGCGLKSLAKLVLDVDLDKSWRIRCGDWEADDLTDRQIEYAAMDALVSLEIFLTLVRRFIITMSVDRPWTLFVKEWLDRPYQHKPRQETNLKKNILVESSYSKMKKANNYSHLVRKSPLYHNCVLQAPNGQSLCTCDIKKVNWYLEKNLAVCVSSEPFVVRLKFDPSGRPTSDEKFYLANRDNRCVVCGAVDSYIRKNVVPLEYRRHFPNIMKDHKSHDVVLLCIDCHRQSNLSNVVLQRRLAECCDAPFGKVTENQEAKRVKSAAKALMISGHGIPPNRRLELEGIVCDHFGVSEITYDQLFVALNLDTKTANDQGTPHGFKVVRKMAERKGLLALERLWRQHFLDAMNPNFLPKLWSVDHGHATLRARTPEGTDEFAALFGPQKT